MADDVLHKLTVYKLSNTALGSVAIPSYKLVSDDDWKIGDKSFPFRLQFFKNGPFQAPWLSVFEPLKLGLAPKDVPQSVVSGFVLFVQVDKSLYAVTGGVGHIHLRKHCQIEHRFGIELARRILAVPELRGLSQRDTGGVVNALDRVFRGLYNPQGDINNLKRVLTHVRGTLQKQNPLQAKIGRSIRASDALTVNGSKTFADVIAFLAEVDTLLEKGALKIIIPQLEHIDRKVHRTLLTELEAGLVDALVNFKVDETHAFFLDNEDIGYLPDRVTKYELIFNYKKYAADTFVDVFVYVRDILSAIKSADKRRDALFRMRLRVHFDDGADDTRALSYFLCGDVEHKNDVYFLNHELWYRASDEFIKIIKSELDNIECIDPAAIGLQDWDKARFPREKDFNAAHKSHVLMDRRLVKVPEEKGGIECCDLLSSSDNTVTLVHVKHDTGAALRALFAQGFVSAKLYAESEVFRSKVHAGDLVANGTAVTKSELRSLKALSQRHRREMRVVFAIFDDTKSHKVAAAATTASQVLKGTLSTFAKVDLLEHVSSLRALGYGVAVSRIRPYP